MAGWRWTLLSPVCGGGGDISFNHVPQWNLYARDLCQTAVIFQALQDLFWINHKMSFERDFQTVLYSCNSYISNFSERFSALLLQKKKTAANKNWLMVALCKGTSVIVCLRQEAFQKIHHVPWRKKLSSSLHSFSNCPPLLAFSWIEREGIPPLWSHWELPIWLKCMKS